MKAINYRPIAKGSLAGAFDLELPSGLILKSCALFDKGGKRWISGPAKKIGSGPDAKYEKLVEFTSRETNERFNKAALEAVDAALAGAAQ
jgi:hypothetical protein